MSRSLKELSFPIQYLEIFESLIRSAGGDVAELHRRCRISRQQLQEMSGTLDGEQLHTAFSVSRPYCQPGRLEVSQYLDHIPLMHGQLGMLAMVSETVADAINMAVQFMPLVLPAFTLRCDLIRDQVHLVLDRQADFGEHDNLLTEVMMGSFSKLLPYLSEPIDDVSIYFKHSCPGNPDLYRFALLERLGGLALPVHFDSAQDKITFGRRALSIPLVTQSRTMREKFVASLSQQARAEQSFKPTSQSVKHLIKKMIEENRVADRESVAQALHMSRRTLSRRLQEEGTTLPQLHAEVRMSYAQTMLLNSDRPIAEIAHRAGFSELSNFTRAYKRMFGSTPTEARGSQSKGA